MHISTITIENFRCFGEGDDRLDLSLRLGLTALVGENDAGKTAVIDALRFALGTTDQDWFRLEDTDFRPGANAKHFKEIKIICKFEGLSDEDKRAFIEYLSYEEIGGNHHQILYVNWTAENTGEIRKGRPYRRVEVHSGKNGDGPSIATEVREFLHATYLRPLRNAEESLLAGRGSRLAQVLRQSNQIREGEESWDDSKSLKELTLSVPGIAKLVNHLLEKHQGVKAAQEDIDKNLSQLGILGDSLASTITVGGVNDSSDAQLKELLEKPDLRLGGVGKSGLGSDNFLFMACELLLLAKDSMGSRLLLIEEPEAHLHPQRQLRVMKYLQEQAEKEKEGIQIIVTTHSPNLTSAIKLNNLVMMQKGRAFSMAEQQTKLDSSDYRFLERFLDVTKANLFFARGVMIVEGDAENILLPTLAKLVGRDFTEYGVSVVNVGGVGLRRYAKIFQRKDEKKDEDEQIVPVLDRILESAHLSCEVLVVVDTRTDTTIPVVERYALKEPRLRCLVNTYGRGPANAIRFGIDAARAPVAVVTMADGCDDARQIDELARLVERGVAVAAASRYMAGGQQVGGPVLKGTLSRAAGRSLRDPGPRRNAGRHQLVQGVFDGVRAGGRHRLPRRLRDRHRAHRQGQAAGPPGRRDPHDLAGPAGRPVQLQGRRSGFRAIRAGTGSRSAAPFARADTRPRAP